VPPFTLESARTKVRTAEAAWNSKDPVRVAAAYTVDCEWRNRSEFIRGREQIVQFLMRKFEKEERYALRKDLWCFSDNRIAVRFQYEYFNSAEGKWHRAYGNENWEFDERGFMRRREASINDVDIDESERRITGPREPGDDDGIPLR